MAPIMTRLVQTMLPVAILVLLIMAVQGEPQRSAPSSIDVGQTNSGKKVGTLDNVFQVTVTNRCQCTVKAVFIRADGFSSSIAVDPKLFRQAGDAGYLVGDGGAIPSGKSITFQYAWDHYFTMTPTSAQAVC